MPAKFLGGCSGKEVGLSEGWWGLKEWGYNESNPLPEVMYACISAVFLHASAFKLQAVLNS